MSFIDVSKSIVNKEMLMNATRKINEGATRMSKMSPLNTIGSGNNDRKEDEEETDLDIVNYGDYNDICRQCQINIITGDCTKCGIYQYVKNLELFDIFTRRRQ